MNNNSSATRLSREDIERIVCEEGYKVRFREKKYRTGTTAIYVIVRLADGTETRQLGNIESLEQWSEAVLRTKITEKFKDDSYR